LNIPLALRIVIPMDTRITDNARRHREWCATLIGRMAWLSGYIADANYVFRGHADTAWNLDSTLHRAYGSTAQDDLEQKETELLESVYRDFWFKREFGFRAAFSATARDYERTLAALQHHGIPTRLIDVTADPLVALYFAVIGKRDVNDMDTVDGSVVMIRNINSDDGEPVHVIPSPQISPRVTAQRSRFVAPSADATASAAPPGRIAIDFFSMDAANGSHGDFNNIILNSLGDDRRGRPPEIPPNVLSFEIPQRVKPACRQLLKGLGISAATLFPGSDGFRRDIAGF
jgi:FRG domain